MSEKFSSGTLIPKQTNKRSAVATSRCFPVVLGSFRVVPERPDKLRSDITVDMQKNWTGIFNGIHENLIFMFTCITHNSMSFIYMYVDMKHIYVDMISFYASILNLMV